MVKSVAAGWWMWDQASTNRPVVWLKSCIAWQTFGATEQTAGDNNLYKWGTVTVGEGMGATYSVSPWNPYVMMKSNNSMSYQLRGHLVKQALGWGNNTLVTTSIARGEQQQSTMKMNFRSYKSMLHQNMECLYCTAWWPATKRSFCTSSEATTGHVIGLAETNITGKGEYDMDKGIKLIYSGEEEGGEAQCGVRFLLNRKADKALIANHLISTWIISIWLSCQGMKAAFIQVYAPTANFSDNEIDSFYNDLQTTLNSIPKKDYVIILGDFNANIGTYQPLWKDTMGKFVIGDINKCMVRDFYSSALQMSYLLQTQFSYTNHQGNELGIILMGCIRAWLVT